MLRNTLPHFIALVAVALLVAVTIVIQPSPAWARPPSQDTPTITLSPASAVPNQAIAVTGKHFTPGGNATVSSITIGGAAIASEKINFGKPVAIDSGGSFVTNLVVPVNSTTLNGDSASISVTDSGGKKASASLAITAPTLSVSPGSSRIGSTVTVTGAKFPIDSGNFGSDDVPQVILEYEVTGGNFERVATAYPSGSGSFAVSFTVPLSVVAESEGNEIRAVMVGSSKEITVTHTLKAPTVTLSPAKGSPGTFVTLQGSNFPAFTPLVSLTMGILGIEIPAGVYTDATGHLTATFEVPETDGGSQSLFVKVGDQQYVQTFYVDNAAAGPQVDNNSVAAASFDVVRTLRPMNDNLLRVFYFDNRTKRWSFYDPRPEVAEFNTLTRLVEGQVYWIGVAEDQAPIIHGSFRNFIKGWNLIVW